MSGFTRYQTVEEILVDEIGSLRAALRELKERAKNDDAIIWQLQLDNQELIERLKINPPHTLRCLAHAPYKTCICGLDELVKKYSLCE